MTEADTNGFERRDRILKEAFQYREALMTQAFVMLRDWAMAEDVMQDSFLVVVNKFEDFHEGTSVYAWARQIVRNKALKALHKRGREVPTEDEALELAVEGAADAYLTEERAEILGEQRRAMEDCMSNLRHPMAEILTGFYWGMESCESLARTHKRSANSIRLILSRMRNELRRCVDRKLRAPAGGL